MVDTKKDILNPVDSLHYDPQKLYEKQVQQSTQIWPRNGGKSFHMLVSFQHLLLASRVNKEASLSWHSLPRQSVTFQRAACSSSTVSLHWKHSQNRNRLANTVFFSRACTGHTLLDGRSGGKQSGGLHLSHRITMLSPRADPTKPGFGLFAL